MRAGGMQAEDTRMHLADGTLVKTPSAPCHRDNPEPRLRGGPSPADTRHVTRQSAAPPARGSRQSPRRGFFYILLLCPREYRRVDAKM